MTETARLLANSIDAFLLRHASATDTELFAALVSDGFALALTSEVHGGMQVNFTEAAAIAIRWGYHAAPLPIVELLMAGRTASVAADPSLATRLTFAQRPASETCAASAAAHPGVEACVMARLGSDDTFIIATEGSETARTIANEPTLRVPFRAPTSQGPRLPALSTLRREAALLTAARMLGSMERIIDIVAEHTTLRTQFGRPLAKFQLVQTMISDAASEVDATRAVLDHALALLDGEVDDNIVWYAAKSQAARAATLVAANAHQLMGAIGFTQEHELHNLTRRLWAWRDAWISQSEAEEALGRQACSASGEGLWSLIADGPSLFCTEEHHP